MQIFKVTAVLLVFCFNASARNKLDTLKVFDILAKASYSVPQVPVDTGVARTIRAIDENINNIVSSLMMSFTPYRFTVIQRTYIHVRRLANKADAVAALLQDTLQANYPKLWQKIKPDSLELIARAYDDHDRYPGNVFPTTVRIIDPLTIGKGLQLQHIIFQSRQLARVIDSVCVRLSEGNKKVFFKYLSENFDYFDAEKKEMIAKAIRIQTITLTDTDLSYAGVDIYGSHYLLTFDKAQNWKLVGIKQLWTY